VFEGCKGEKRRKGLKGMAVGVKERGGEDPLIQGKRDGAAVFGEEGRDAADAGVGG
jgi:hypothetical protein